MAGIPPRFSLICALVGAFSITACNAERRPDPFPGTAGNDRATLAVDGQLYTGYGIATRERGGETETADGFFVDRAEVGLGYAAPAGPGFEIRLESVRTAVAGSYIGVAGNSLVTRVRRARGFWSGEVGPVGLDVEMGLLTAPWAATLLPRFHLRGTGNLLTLEPSIIDANDLGALVGVRLWHDRIRLTVGALNGEGRAETELNRDSDLVARLSFEGPVAEMGGAPLMVGVHGVYRRGTIGPEPAPARNDRLGGALTVVHPDYGLGATYLRADGFEGRADDQAEAIEVWADARLLAEWLGVAVRWSQLGRKPSGGSVVSDQRLTAGVFGDLHSIWPGLNRARLYVLYDNQNTDGEAATVPGLAEETQGVRVVLEMAAGRRF